MTGQEMINMCSSIIKRQDINTDLLLTFINQQRKFILRSNYLYKIQSWVTNLTATNGLVTITTGTLKQARYVEWNSDPTDIEVNVKKKLLRLNTINEAYEFIDDVDAEGEPQYYIVMSEGIKIIPAPPVGKINIFGEWYPTDYISGTNSNLSDEDVISKELGDIVVYNSCAEYFDFLEEYEKAQLWRNKGKVLLDEYFKEIKRQMTDDRNLMDRDPFGNLGIHHGWRDFGVNKVDLNRLIDADEVSY